MKKLVGTVLLSSILIAPSAVSAKTFPDVPQDFWAEESIDVLSDRGTMNGFPDGTFKPNEPVKRIQAGAMIMKELGLEVQGEVDPESTDISSDFPSRDVVDVMEETGILRGSNGNFRPYEPLTRAQMASVLTRAFELEHNENYYFTDIQPDYWNYSDISSLAHSGITGGKGDGTFAPSEPTTRAQFVTFLHRAIDKMDEREPLEPLAGDYGEYVWNDGLLYGAFSNTQFKAYTKNENGEYEEVENYRFDEMDLKGERYNAGGNMQVVDDSIYLTVEGYKEGEQQAHLYSFKDGEFTLIQEDAPENWYFYDGAMYYTQDGALYRDGNIIIKMNDQNVDYAGSTVYYQGVASGVRTYNLETGEQDTVHAGPLNNMTVFEDKLLVTREISLLIRDLEGNIIENVSSERTPAIFEERANGMTVYLGDGIGPVDFIER